MNFRIPSEIIFIFCFCFHVLFVTTCVVIFRLFYASNQHILIMFELCIVFYVKKNSSQHENNSCLKHMNEHEHNTNHPLINTKKLFY